MLTFPTPLRPAEALRRSGTAIDVPDGESVAVGYFSSSYADVYRIAEVSTFEDLQTLGLIPGELSEDLTRQALAADDDSFREQAGAARPREEACCTDCAEHGSTTKRRWHQPHLAQLLTTTIRRNLTVDSPEVLMVHHHVGRLLNSRGVMLVGIAYPDDIDIGAGSTLLMAPTVHVLNADVITIKSDGVLRFEAANVHVRCAEIKGPKVAPLVIPHLEIPKYIIPDELTVGGLLEQLPAAAESTAGVLTAHRHLAGFRTEHLLSHNAFQH